MVELLVTYMEAFAPPPESAFPPLERGAVIARERLDADAYLSLYRAVGSPFDWDSRLRLSRPDLDALLARPSNVIFVLRIAGHAVGLCEFENVGHAEVELVHFGLVPQAQGRLLGPRLLQVALSRIWEGSPRRVWLHTDTNDHPKAVAVYRRAGFTVFDQRREVFED